VKPEKRLTIRVIGFDHPDLLKLRERELRKIELLEMKVWPLSISKGIA